MPEYRTHETPVYAVYPSRNPSAKTRTFIDFLASRYGRARDDGAEAEPGRFNGKGGNGKDPGDTAVDDTSDAAAPASAVA
jgi:hypothetical protein